MKTTNDIERSVLHKVFHEHQPEALGIIETESGDLTVRNYLSYMNFLE
jgi:hypothetical protein